MEVLNRSSVFARSASCGAESEELALAYPSASRPALMSSTRKRGRNAMLPAGNDPSYSDGGFIGDRI